VCKSLSRHSNKKQLLPFAKFPTFHRKLKSTVSYDKTIRIATRLKMAVAMKMLEHVREINDYEQQIIRCLRVKDDYKLLLVIASVEVVAQFRTKKLLPHLTDFDNLVDTLVTCYENDLNSLLEVSNEYDQTDLLHWSHCVHDIWKDRHGSQSAGDACDELSSVSQNLLTSGDSGSLEILQNDEWLSQNMNHGRLFKVNA